MSTCCKKRKRGNGNNSQQGGRLYNRCPLKRVIQLLQEKLDEETKQRFSETTFGTFLYFPKCFVYQGSLQYLLMQHLDDTCCQKEMLCFNINGKTTTFGPDEFLAITGLKFGDQVRLPHSSKLWAEVFKRKPTLHLRDIENAFKKSCTRHKGHGDQVLKLGLMFFAYACLIGSGSFDRFLDLKYLPVFDNINSVNSYPWGLVSYQYLVKEYFQSRAYMDFLRADQKYMGVQVHGFLPAIQVWAFEVFPEIAYLCAFLYDDPHAIKPRMLRWWCNEHYLYSEVQPLFQDIQMVPITYDQEEKEMIMAARFSYGTICKPSLEPFFDGPRVKRQLKFHLVDEDGKMPNDLGISSSSQPIIESTSMPVSNPDIKTADEPTFLTRKGQHEDNLAHNMPTRLLKDRLCEIEERFDRLEKMLLAGNEAGKQVFNSTSDKVDALSNMIHKFVEVMTDAGLITKQNNGTSV